MQNFNVGEERENKLIFYFIVGFYNRVQQVAGDYKGIQDSAHPYDMVKITLNSNWYSTALLDIF